MRVFVPWMVFLGIHQVVSVIVRVPKKGHLILPAMSDHYEPKPTLKQTYQLALQAGTLGLIVSTVQNALGQHSHGAMGVFTRTGGTIGFFGTSFTTPLLPGDLDINRHLAAMGATFAFTKGFIANERRTDDALNGAAGGCAAGFLAGIRCRFIVTDMYKFMGTQISRQHAPFLWQPVDAFS